MVTPKGILALALICLSFAQAQAITDAEKCEADKLKTAGKYGFCRLKAEAKALKTASTPDYTRCADKYGLKWGLAESVAGIGLCPSEGDEAAIQTFITQHTDEVAAALAGGPLPDCPGDLATCNGDLTTCTSGLTTCNGSLTTCTGNLGTCTSDLATADASLTACSSNLTSTTIGLSTCNANLTNTTASLTMCNSNLDTCTTDLATCQAVPQGQRMKTGQTTCYNVSGTVIACAGTGQDGELQKGLARQHVDNNDGTITDFRTGLMWEKLSYDGSIHDKGSLVSSWADAFSHIGNLNTVAFANYADWRLPNRNELESLISLDAVNPSIAASFNTDCVLGCTVFTCSCTEPKFYWSSTTFLVPPSNAWAVGFDFGSVRAFAKSDDFVGVRAVRGGS